MGNCTFCKAPAGFLRSQHAACQQKHEAGVLEIIKVISIGFSDSSILDVLYSHIEELSKNAFIDDREKSALHLRGWSIAVDKAVDDDLVTDAEELSLVKLAEALDLKQNDLNATGAMVKLTKAIVIREVVRGILPQRFSLEGNLPINFQKDEKTIWAFPNSGYLEDKVRRQYVGTSQGVSIPVMKGLYYRVGAFKGETVESVHRVHVDTGWVVVTTKNIYFAGSRKSLRLPYSKIVSFEPFRDGLGVMRDTQSATLQVFATGDGWFTYNLVRNLSQL